MRSARAGGYVSQVLQPGAPRQLHVHLQVLHERAGGGWRRAIPAARRRRRAPARSAAAVPRPRRPGSGPGAGSSRRRRCAGAGRCAPARGAPRRRARLRRQPVRAARRTARHAGPHRRHRTSAPPRRLRWSRAATARTSRPRAPRATGCAPSPSHSPAGGGGRCRKDSAFFGIQPCVSRCLRAASASVEAPWLMLRPPRLPAAAGSRCGRSRAPGPARRSRRCVHRPAAAPNRAPAIRSSAGSATRSGRRCPAGALT